MTVLAVGGAVCMLFASILIHVPSNTYSYNIFFAQVFNVAFLLFMYSLSNTEKSWNLSLPAMALGDTLCASRMDGTGSCEWVSEPPTMWQYIAVLALDSWEKAWFSIG